MSLPHEFIPGEVARSADVNENFAYLISILGELTTPDRVRTSTEFQMGSRQNVLLTATHDTGSAANAFFQIGWNADWNLSNGKWQFTRFNNGEAATAVRIGKDGFSIYTTADTSGDLNGPLRNPAFTVRRTATTNHIYIPVDTNITISDGSSMSTGEYRLTFVPFSSPKTINEGAWGSGTTHFDAKNFGVPSSAIAIQITCEATSSGGSARCRFMQRRTSPSVKYGFSVAANTIGSGQGMVLLGNGSNAIDFTVERTASFSSVNAYITGYWV